MKEGNVMEKNNNNIEGIGFIKSRKPEATIDKISELIYAKAKEYEIERPKILIDDGCYTCLLYTSQRLISTVFCDKIVYLEDGKIIEIGSHKELMEKKGKYAEMFEIQRKMYVEKEG